MSSEFEKNVMTSLESINDRLTNIEQKIEEATSFADSVLGEGGVLPDNGLDAIRSTFSSLLNPGSMHSGEETNNEAESIGDLVSSLRTFQDRLSSIKDAMSDLPTSSDEDK